MNNTREEMEIDLMQLFAAVLRKWWMLVIAVIVGGVVAFGYTYFFVTPTYQASVLMYVNSSVSVGGKALSISAGDINTAKTLVETYRVILGTRLTLEEVIEVADLDYSYGQLNSMISSAAVNGTEIFRITVTGPDPEEACKIANTISYVLPDKIADVVEGSSVRTVDMAVVPGGRSSPNYSKNTVMGMVIGFVLSAGIIVLMYMFNDSIQSEDWLIQTFKDDIPLLAIIPDTNPSDKRRYGYYKRGYYKSHYAYKENSSENPHNSR